MFGALKRGFRSTASLILVRNVVGVFQPKRIRAASRGFFAAAWLSCFIKGVSTSRAVTSRVPQGIVSNDIVDLFADSNVYYKMLLIK